MKFKHLIYVTIVALLVSAVGLVAAQDGQTRGKNGAPFVGIRYAEAEGGVVVEEVVADSPAATAGLEVGDVVTAVDGEAITIANFATVIRAKAVGDTVVLTVTRTEASQEISVTLGESIGRQGGRRSGIMPEILSNQPFLGVRLEDQDGALTVAEVVADSPAATTGLQVGDVITQLNGEAVTDAESFVASVQSLEVGAEVALTITRDGTEAEVTATLGAVTLEDFIQIMPGMGGRGGHGNGDGNGRGDGQGFGRGALGIQLEETEQGVTVTEVVAGSAAEQIGIQTGDIIKSIAGTEVTSIDQVRSALRDAHETGEISLTLDRAGTNVELSFAVGDLSNLDLPRFNFGRGGRMPFAGAFLGIETALLSEETAQEYGVTQTSGLYVVRVVQDSTAAEAGLQARDIITAINGQAITDAASIRTALSDLNLGDTVTLDVLRGTETIQVEVTLEMMPGAGLRFPFPIVPDSPNQSDEQEDQKSA